MDSTNNSESKSIDSSNKNNNTNNTSDSFSSNNTDNTKNNKNNGGNKRNQRRNFNNADKKNEGRKGKQPFKGNSSTSSLNDNSVNQTDSDVNKKSNNNNKNGKYRNNKNKKSDTNGNISNDTNSAEGGNNNNNNGKKKPRNNNKNKKKYNDGNGDGETSTTNDNDNTSTKPNNKNHSRHRNNNRRRNNNNNSNEEGGDTSDAESSTSHLDEKSSKNYKRNVLMRKPKDFGKLTISDDTDENKDSSKESLNHDHNNHNHNHNGSKNNSHRSNRAHNQRLTNMEKVELMTKKVTNASDQDLQFNLIVELTNSTYECMVCYNIVKPKDYIWSCPICYNVFHLNCIKKWARTDVSTANEDGGWRCPGCQSAIEEVPNKYTCFCGKIENPRFNPYITPHSCTNICGRPRDCSHPCREQCHPGPCPPCTLFAPEEKCYCGKKSYTYRCSDLQKNHQVIMEQKCCGEVCGKFLNCGRHTCTKLCHPGPCDDCKETVTESCYCGQESREFSCGTDHKYSCHTPCTYVYPCGVHHCERKCHPPSEHGPCCPYDPLVMYQKYI